MSNFSWDLDKSGGGGGNKAEFVKFPEGITRIRIIDDAPYQRWIHFMRAHKRSINCPGKGCPICEIRKQEKANGIKQHTYDMQKRFALNVINRETKRVEILEQGKTFIQDLIDLRADLAQDGHTIKDADIKVRRRGSTKDDTSYRLDVDKVFLFDEADQVLLLNKINLEEYFAPHTPEQILRIIQGEDWNEVMKNETTAPANDETPNPWAEGAGQDEDIALS